jgi:hypothetical protein
LLAVSTDDSDLTDTDSFIHPGRVALRSYDSELGSNRYLTFLLRPTVSSDVRRLLFEGLR